MPGKNLECLREILGDDLVDHIITPMLMVSEETMIERHENIVRDIIYISHRMNRLGYHWRTSPALVPKKNSVM